MGKGVQLLCNEDGTVLFAAIVFLALLTLVGVSSISTSTTEVRIASNAQYNKIEFYIADSGWKQGAMWLNDNAGPPIYKNSSGSIVRNFGDGDTDDLNNDLADGTEDSPHDSTPNDMSRYAIPYWFKVIHLPDETETVSGSNKNYQRYFYNVDSNANRTQEIEVIVSKVFKTGYN
jgi:PilX N-terminal